MIDQLDPLLTRTTRPLERLVILPLEGAVVDTSVLHLPGAPIPKDSAPFLWLSACGVEGIVYAQAGPLALAPVCGDCCS